MKILNKIKIAGFSVAEMMVVLLILSIIIAASMPIITRRTKSSLDKIWQPATNGADAYFGTGATQGAAIGTNSFPTNHKGKLLLNVANTTATHILFSISNTLDVTNGGKSITGKLRVSNGQIEFGLDAVANGANTIAIGNGAKTGTDNSSAYGYSANADGASSLALGSNTTAGGEGSVAVGVDAVSSVANTTALGYGATSSQTGATSIGYSAIANSTNTSSLGYNAKATASGATSLGYGSETQGSYGVSVGAGAKASGDYGVALGYGSASSSNALALGSSASATFENSVAIGPAATTSAANQIVIGNSSYASGGIWLQSASVYVNGAILNTSDIRKKNVIGEYKSGLDDIMKIKTYEYVYKDDLTKTKQVGVIAQELQKIFPNAVKKDSKGYLSIRKDDMFYAVINAVKQLGTDVKALKEENELLKLQVKELTERIERLEAK